MPCSFDAETALRAGGFTRIAGVDEAGRGCLAGPVVAGAVILPHGMVLHGLDDSKKMSRIARERLYRELTEHPDVCWAVASVGPGEIDRVNILQASHQAMRLAVEALSPVPDFALIDGLPVRPFPVANEALVGGDGRSFSIAAASVLAKVTRDRLLLELDARHPAYGFARHKGYATAQHLAMLRTHGPCEIHRRTFEPVAQCHFGF